MRPYGIALALAAAATVAACVRSPWVNTSSSGEVVPNTVPRDGYTLPAGMSMGVTLNQQLDVATSRPNDTFSATLTKPVTTVDRQVAVPAGALAWGHVTGVRTALSAGETSAIVVDFDSLTFGGRRHALAAAVTEVQVQPTRPMNGPAAVRNAADGNGGTPPGTIFTAADKARLFAATAGANGVPGTAISLGTQTASVSLPVGSTMTLRTTHGISLQH